MPKINLTPHLCWAIAVLLAVISYFLLNVPGGDKVNSYISFASSLASLILAVVAIFYSIVSTASQTSLLHNVEQAAKVFSKASGEIDRASATLAEISSGIDRHASAIPNEFALLKNSLVGKIDEISNQRIDYKKDENRSTSTDGQPDFPNRVSVVSVTSMHMLSQAYLIGKPIDAKMFTSSQKFQDVFFGFCHALKLFSPCGIKLDNAGWSFQVQSFGHLDPQYWVEISFDGIKGGPLKALFQFYDHFDLELPAGLSARKSTEDDTDEAI